MCLRLKLRPAIGMRVPPFFLFPPLLVHRRRSIDTGLLYWAASRHRLFLYSPVVSPDLPLMGLETTDRHRACVRKEVAARWKVSFMVQVGREIFEQQAGRKRSSCGNPRLILNVNAWTPCGGPVLGAGGEPKENYIYKFGIYKSLYLRPC